MQGIENSELVFAPARETTLFHKEDSASGKITAAQQHDIKLQEAAVRAQPGDTSGLAVQSWVLGGDRHDLAIVVPRGETIYARPRPAVRAT